MCTTGYIPVSIPDPHSVLRRRRLLLLCDASVSLWATCSRHCAWLANPKPRLWNMCLASCSLYPQKDESRRIMRSSRVNSIADRRVLHGHYACDADHMARLRPGDIYCHEVVADTRTYGRAAAFNDRPIPIASHSPTQPPPPWLRRPNILRWLSPTDLPCMQTNIYIPLRHGSRGFRYLSATDLL